jgi:hypothetical protein
MSRHARIEAPHSLHHGIGRCLNRDYLIFGPEAREEYLRRVPMALDGLDARLIGFGAMSNHAHWAIQSGEAPLSRFFQSLHGGFAGWINRSLERLGPVFAGRYSDIVCPEERTAILLAYIHNNPVRANVVGVASDSDWTSHRAYLGEAPAPPWLDVEWGLAAGGFSASPSGRSAFDTFVNSRAPLGRDPLLSGDCLEPSRRVVRRVTGADAGVTDPELSHDLTRSRCRVVLVPSAVVRPRWPGAAWDVVLAVARRLGVTTAEIGSRDRRRHAVEARRLALWLWRYRMGRQQVEMCGVLGVSESSASELLSRRDKLDPRLIEELAAQLWNAEVREAEVA